MKYYIFLSIQFLLLSNSFAQCDLRYEDEISTDYILHEDLIYGNNVTSEDEWIDLKLDVYEPAIPSDQPRPLVILAHGGSFSSGNKKSDEVRWFCEDLAKRGIVTASINYRLESSLLSLLSKEQMIKAVIRATEDAKASVRFFHKSIAEGNPYNIDEDYIIAGGSSAGSIAVMHAVYLDKYHSIPNDYQNWILELFGDTTMNGNSGNPGYSDKVSGIINISGAIVHTRHLNDNTDIPILSIHNQWDFTIPFVQGHPFQLPFLPNVMGSSHIHNQMTAVGGYSKLYVIPAFNHVPHTQFDGTKNVEIYNKSMDEIVRLLRHIEPCADLPTAQLNELSESFTIFPNPAHDFIEIVGLEHLSDYSFQLLDLNGKELVSEINANNNRIALPKLSTGLYLLRGINEGLNTVLVRKLMIE